MRILIDARVLDREITGTGRYLLNILEELPNQDGNNEYFLLSNKIIDNLNTSFYRNIKIETSILPNKIYSPIALNFIIPQIIKKYKIDVFFEPNILVPLLTFSSSKIVSVVHDVIPKVYKSYYPFLYRKYLSTLLPISLKKSDKILTVSEQSKNDIRSFFGISPDKIEVAYNTASKRFVPINTTKVEYKTKINSLLLPQKFLLYVGAIEKRKNILGLLKILDIVHRQGSKLKLVLVGKPGYDSKNIIPEIKKRDSQIMYFRYLDDTTLVFLYNLAFAFVFPSHYEGFGIPPLEAMQCGLPVLSSNTSALKEVVASGGIMHSPDDYLGFAQDILKLESDNAFYNLMKIRALEQSKRFDISVTARKIVSVFNELNNNKSSK